MLVSAIQFEIRNFANGTSEQFLIPNNELNYSLIAGHKYTREIHFTQVFSFQFDKEMRCPAFMQEALIAEVIANCGTEHEFEIDPIDEMVGINY